MLIKEIYIENFGKLSGAKMSFGRGLNTLCRDNGFGKTTLSVFIKAMLYGLDDGRSHSLLENERKRYTPWQGGAFGGYMIFSDGKSTYRIERSFGSKPSEDKLAIYDEAGEQIPVPSRPFGEELFGIDSQGFERTLFLSEKKLNGINKNQTISAKLSDLCGVEGDICDFDSAIKLLEQKRKFYRLKGGRGAIQDTAILEAELKDKLKAIEAERKNYKDYAEQAASLTESLQGIGEKKQALLKKRSVAISQRELGAYRSQYKNMEMKLGELMQKERTCLEFFSKKLPTFEEISAVSDKIRRLESIDEANPYADSSKDAMPCPFAVIPSEDDVKSHSSYKAPEPIKKRNPLYLVLGIIFLVLGAGLGAFVSYPLFATSIIGVLFFAAYLLAKKSYYPVGKEAEFYAEQDEFLKRIYGKDSADGLSFDGLLRDLAEYKSALAARDAYNAVILQKQKELEAGRDSLLLEIASFITLFPTETDEPIAEIQRRLTEYEIVKRQRCEAEKELSEFGAAHKLNETEAEAIISLGEVEDEIATLENESLELSRKKIIIEGYMKNALMALDTYPETLSKLEDVSCQLSRYKESYNTIIKAQELLLKAKNNMTARYIGATKAAFDKYMKLFGSKGEEYSLDTDFDAYKIDLGQTRPAEAYSLGTRELYNLLVRLSLNDALYEGKKPPIILDDPFSYFDDKRVKEAMTLLSELAKDRQIIYMTCSKSRNL